MIKSVPKNVMLVKTVFIISTRNLTRVQNVPIITSHVTNLKKYDILVNSKRHFLGNNNNEAEGTSYREKLIIGYSREQMCNLVYDVAKYKEFVPFCTGSHIISNQAPQLGKFNLKTMNRNNMSLNLRNIERNPQMNLPKHFRAQLDIGYPPIKESYVSNVTSIHPQYVKAISRDTNLFEYLISEWKFHPNPDMYAREHLNSRTELELKELEKSCLVEFYVSFKFANSLYSAFSEVLMDQIFKAMVSAFTDRAAVLYGKPSMLPKPVNLVDHRKS